MERPAARLDNASWTAGTTNGMSWAFTLRGLLQKACSAVTEVLNYIPHPLWIIKALHLVSILTYSSYYIRSDFVSPVFSVSTRCSLETSSRNAFAGLGLTNGKVLLLWRVSPCTDSFLWFIHENASFKGAEHLNNLQMIFLCLPCGWSVSLVFLVSFAFRPHGLQGCNHKMA